MLSDQGWFADKYDVVTRLHRGYAACDDLVGGEIAPHCVEGYPGHD